MYEGNGDLELYMDSMLKYQGTASMHARFERSSTSGSSTFLVSYPIELAQSVSQYTHISFSVRFDRDVRGEVQVELWDADGDRFIGRFLAPPSDAGWVRVRIRLDDLFQTSWSQPVGNRDLNLEELTKWSLGLTIYGSESCASIWFDDLRFEKLE